MVVKHRHVRAKIYRKAKRYPFHRLAYTAEGRRIVKTFKTYRAALAAPLATNPDLRNLLKKAAKAAEQTIDVISRDTLLFAGPAQTSTQNNAEVAKSFRDYIEQHRAEITALQILYSRPYKQRLTQLMLKEA